MAHRYRLYPTAEQSVFMLGRHCADARFVWNLAVEQFNWGRAGRPAPGSAQRQRQLAEARQASAWLAAGSSSVQQQALRDSDRNAAANILARAILHAPTPGPGATPAQTGVLAQARTPNAA